VNRKLVIFFIVGVLGVAGIHASQFHNVCVDVYRQVLSGKESVKRQLLIKKKLQTEIDKKEQVDLEFVLEEEFSCRAHLDHRSGLEFDILRKGGKIAGFSTDKVICEFSVFLHAGSKRIKYTFEIGLMEGSIIPNRHIIGGEVTGN